MQLVYSNEKQTTIKVTLDEGEQLGRKLVGPKVVYVPVNPKNADYAAIVEQKLTIEPYKVPIPPPPSSPSTKRPRVKT